MTLALMLLAVAVSTLLTAGAWSIDRALRPVRIATRFVWAAVMLATVVLVSFGALRALTAAPSEAVLLDVIRVGGMIDMLDPLGTSMVDAALSGATAAARRWLPAWAGSVLLAAWLCSSIGTALWFLGGARRQRRMLARSGEARIAGERVRISDGFGPAVIGVRRPTIVLPRWLLTRSASEQALVVAHERAHVEARDPLLLLAGVAALVSMPWNPVMWLAFSRLRLAMELDCDARVLRSGAPALAYGTLLLDLTAALPPAQLGAAAFAARPSQLEARILAMSTRPFTAGRRAAAVVAAVVVGAVVTIAACSAEVRETPVMPDGTTAAPAATLGPLALDQPYFDFQVEKPVQPVAGTGMPKYPAILRSAGVDGEVLAQFVVDTLGRVEPASFKVVRKSHDLFEASVRTALPEMRFTPAEIGGKPVRQLVQQPFVFQLAR